EAMAGADVVVMTAGVPRKPGQSREELININSGIVRDICKNVKTHAPDSVLIVVSNPLDAMVFVAKQVTGFPRERVIGSAGVLDSARFRTYLSMAAGCSVEDVHAIVLGAHTDKDMVPVISTATIGNVPVSKFLNAEQLTKVVDDTKKGGAWMDSAITRRRLAQGIETPVAYLVCNFPGPVGGKPATFSHDDVITLFHESGHGLHHLLTRVDDLAVSGIHGVEWDAVELPSQFMENFCWEWDVVREMTAHADTGNPLPKELFDKMLAAKNFQSGMQTVRQLEFSLFDLLIHMDFDAESQDVLALLAEVRKEVAVLVPPAWHRFPNSFSHIFAGGYAAGYYSYKWAEVLSADAFAAFEEAGRPKGSVLDAETGARFWDEILAVGGSRPALDSFKAFRGREPQVDALLRHSGMVPA
ncbi:MAG: M3 family metallopeptidase, partial [Proteobacteria bacterium]|nr:M3 family metallopeptidase [Pseudomonadota bacterium]